jgi:putative NADH-flavin reductase
MKITIFGATGDLGNECVQQALDAGHEITVLARTPSKLPGHLASRVVVLEGDGLNAEDVERALSEDTDAILFAIGIDKHSPEDLSTDATRHIVGAMRRFGIRRFVWCGGGSTFVDEDVITFGAKFVRFFASTFMGLRHRDKEHQLELLDQNLDLDWIGIRPLQMGKGPRRAEYRLGFNEFSGFSKISFADCAHAMIHMLRDDTWIHKAPIVQY